MICRRIWHLERCVLLPAQSRKACNILICLKFVGDALWQGCRTIISGLLRSQPKLVRKDVYQHISLSFPESWHSVVCEQSDSDWLPTIYGHCSRGANIKVFSKYCLYFPQWNVIYFHDYNILASIKAFPVVYSSIIYNKWCSKHSMGDWQCWEFCTLNAC